jgi:putative transposase
MPRIARIIATDLPHHITQRGNNRATVFFDDEDRRTYLRLLAKYSALYDVRLWAYCLMDNHVHLLAVPATEQGLARGIGLTNQVYTQYLNRKRAQSGRVWQNRFHSCVVGDDRYLWEVVRYIERNPLQAGLANRAKDYPWSSAKAHLTGKEDELLAAPSWLEPAQKAEYSRFLASKKAGMGETLRKATATGRPFSSPDFIAALEKRLAQSLRAKPVGRPPKK